jgi:2-succinyl-6-hydroxy-2,4-cyclohexadiene-1-carboxylate synthase
VEHSNGNERTVMGLKLFIHPQQPTKHLAMHGFWGSGKDFDALQKYLSFDITTIDLLGFGKSSISTNLDDYSTANQCMLLYNLLPPLHIISYSMGARLALQYAIKYPIKVKSLICIGVQPGIQDLKQREQRRLWDQGWAKQFGKTNSLSQVLHDWSRLPILQSLSKSEQWNKIRMRRLQQSPIGLQNSMLGFGTGIMPPCWNELSSISCPVLLIHGELDDKYTSIHKEMHKHIPNCTLSKIPLVGHAPHIEVPKQTAHIIEQWYDSNHILDEFNI